MTVWAGEVRDGCSEEVAWAQDKWWKIREKNCASRRSGKHQTPRRDWVIKIFLYSSSVYYCHLFLISSASVRSIPFLYCAHLCMKCSLGISNFLEEISSLSHSIVFLYFFSLTPANAGDVKDAGSIPGSGRSPGEGNSNPFQYSCLEKYLRSCVKQKL